MSNTIISLIKKGNRYAIRRSDRILFKWLNYDVGRCYVWSFSSDFFPSDIASWRFYELTGKWAKLEGEDGIVDTHALDGKTIPGIIIK